MKGVQDPRPPTFKLDYLKICEKKYNRVFTNDFVGLIFGKDKIKKVWYKLIHNLKLSLTLKKFPFKDIKKRGTKLGEDKRKSEGKKKSAQN